MKNKIIYIRLFSIIGICLLLMVLGLYYYKNKESFTNNGLDVYNNLGFIGINRRQHGNGLSGDVSGYNASDFGGRWGNDIAKKFLSLQSTINPSYIFNVDYIQKYVSKNDVQQFLLNGGKWNWSDETKTQYLLYMNSNSLVKSWGSEYFNMNILQTIYPEHAIKILLKIKSNTIKNKITPFENSDEDKRNVGVLYEGIDKNGSGIFTFGSNSGLLSNCNTCYEFV
jgi:hypothetical protein